MRRRRGITLIEVLVAIFIMAIGLLAILTLFPLGALRMGEALQDDRAAASASAGANTCDAFGVRNDASFLSSGVNLYLAPPPAYNLQAVVQNGTGYPLYVDPWGLGSGDPNIVGVPPNAFPRVAPSVFPPPYNTAPSMAIRYFSLPDDMTFYDDGTPDTGSPPGSTPIQRGGRYTWAYLLHRSQPASPTAPVDLTVVVYAGRATSVPGGENTFTAAGAIGDTAVLVSWGGGQPPNIKRGRLDSRYQHRHGRQGQLCRRPRPLLPSRFRVAAEQQRDEPGTADPSGQGAQQHNGAG